MIAFFARTVAQRISSSETPVSESCDQTANFSLQWMITALVLMVTTASTSTACVVLGCVAFHNRAVSKTPQSGNPMDQQSKNKQLHWHFTSHIRTCVWMVNAYVHVVSMYASMYVVGLSVCMYVYIYVHTYAVYWTMQVLPYVRWITLFMMHFPSRSQQKVKMKESKHHNKFLSLMQ